MRVLAYRVSRRGGRLSLDLDRIYGVQHFRAVRALVIGTVYELVLRGGYRT